MTRPDHAARVSRQTCAGAALRITLAAAASLASLCAFGADAAAEAWALHGQATHVTQRHDRFRSPYAGTNSLVASGRTEETTDATLYAGLRLWHGAELWADPELDQGFGLSNTVGVAGFPSGEAYKVGANPPYLRLPRFFLRQTIPLGSSDEPVAAAANQLAGIGLGHTLFRRRVNGKAVALAGERWLALGGQRLRT